MKKTKTLKKAATFRTKIPRSTKAISPVIATLLMIAIAVVASLVAYAFVTGYIGSTTSKTGKAIQLQSFAVDDSSNLHVYVQNVGQGDVELNQDGSVYVNNQLVPINVPNQPQIPITEGQTIDITVPLPSGYSDGDRLEIKVTTTDGTFMTTTGTGTTSTGGSSGSGPLSLTLNVIGSGLIEKSPDQATYNVGDPVVLTATPTQGWIFTGWSGDLTSSTSPDTVIIDSNPQVTATFTQSEYQLTVTASPPAGGSINIDLTPPYQYGDVVTLTAIANPGYSFTAWAGDLTSTTSPETIIMNGDKTITATFSQTQQQPQDIILHPNGPGSTTQLDDRGTSPNYACVNEVPDNTNYYVRGTGDDSWQYDSYNLDDQSLTGQINSVTVFMLVQKDGSSNDNNLDACTVIRLNGGTMKTGTNRDISGVTSWTQYSDSYTSKPTELGGGSWTWTDINNLQIGVGLRSHDAGWWIFSDWTYSECTQVWAVVNYTPSP